MADADDDGYGDVDPPGEGMAPWRLSAQTTVGNVAARTPGAASRASPPLPQRDDVGPPAEAAPRLADGARSGAAPVSESTITATPPSSDEEGGLVMTSATYVALPAPVAVVAVEPVAEKMARTPRGGVDKQGALAILAQTTMDDLAKGSV
jgi:hypothetical protein